MNPRWEAAEARRRSARMWKIIVRDRDRRSGTTVIVVSCHDRRERARRDVAEPAQVETTGAAATSRSDERASAEAVTPARLRP